jgi:hypothetical protein
LVMFFGFQFIVAISPLIDLYVPRLFLTSTTFVLAIQDCAEAAACTIR